MAVWASTDAGFGDKVARFPEERLRMVTALVATVARDPPFGAARATSAVTN